MFKPLKYSDIVHAIAVAAAVVCLLLAAVATATPASAKPVDPIISVNSLDAGPLPTRAPLPGGEVSAATVTPEQARDADARSYAADFGVTLAEARERLTGQQSLGEALERLEERFPASFAGGWIEHAPAFRAVARFKGAVPPEAGGLAGADVVLRGGATRTLAELGSRADEVFADVADSWDATVATSFDVRTGRVEVSIETPTKLRGATEAQLRSRLPASARSADVRVAFADAPVAGNEHTYAGAVADGTRTCTTGFTVYKVSDGTGGVLTAGHCVNDLDYVEPEAGGLTYDTDWQDGHRGPWGDVQWHTTDHGEHAEFYDSTLGRRDVHGYNSSVVQGYYRCKYGRTTSYGCSDVYRTSVSITDDDGFNIDRLVAVEAHITDNGDSGGPWFIVNDAVGIHQGRATINNVTRSLFSRIAYADNALPGIGLLVNP